MTAIRNDVARSTYVNSAKPAANYEMSTRLGVKGTAQYSYIYFARPFPLGASIVSAKLRIKTKAMNTGTHVLTVSRCGARTTYSRMNWANQPTVINYNSASVTKTGVLPEKTEWEFDVSAMMQQISDGALWYGFRVATTENVQRWLYAEESGHSPVLEMEWSDAPNTPEGLVPSGGLAVGLTKPTLRFDYIDVSGDVELESVHVQINSTNTWTAPTFDSGVVDASEPELNLATTAYAGLPTNGTPVWWRVRAKDGAGLWSKWSGGEQMRYVARPTVNVTSPTGQFYDSTQVIAWTAPGQAAYQVAVYAFPLTDKALWNTGKVTSTDTSITVPPGVVRWDDRKYKFLVRSWDSQQRVSTPGSPAYGQTIVHSTYDNDVAIPAVTGLTAVNNGGNPFVTLSWSYGSLPDSWVISRNGEVVVRIDSDEITPVGGKYTYTNRMAFPNKENTYVIRPVVNGKAGKGATVKITPRPTGIWLMTADDALCIVGQDSGSWEMVEHATEHQVLGATKPTIVNQGIGGYTGEIQGQLVSGVGGERQITASMWRDKALAFKEQAAKGKTFRLAVADMSIPVKIGNVVPTPRPEEEIMFDISFSFWQDGELPF